MQVTETQGVIMATITVAQSDLRRAAHAQGMAVGAMTVMSGTLESPRVECHGASLKSVRAVSDACTCKPCRDIRTSGGTAPGKSCPTFTSPRSRLLATYRAFWTAQGVARETASGWEGRDLINGAEWLPFAGAGDAERFDRVEVSHLIACANGGAWCPCNALPEVGGVNAGRGDANVSNLTPSARAVVAAWPAWWKANAARGASLARLSE